MPTIGSSASGIQFVSDIRRRLRFRGALSHLLVQDQQCRAVVAGVFQQPDGIIHRPLFFDLFVDEPFEKRLGGIVAFVHRQFIERVIV